jgi:Glu-tRNA(Gln) amidotransferase subunit E-like FAD-binding protein
VPEDCIVPLVTSRWGTIFENLVRKYDVEPRLAATTLAYKVKGWRRRGWPVEKLTANDIERTFVLYQQGAILREAIPVALARYLQDNRPLRQILNDLGRRRDAEKRLPDEITLLKRRLKRRTFRNGPDAVRAHAIGQLMASFRGLIPYAALAEAVEKTVLPAFSARQREAT